MAVKKAEGPPPLPTRRQLIIRRSFDAPRDLVWKAWTDREQAAAWWGPRDFTTRITRWGTRPGEAWRAIMRSAGGEEFPQHGVVQEIVRPERLVYSFIRDDEAGSEMKVTMTLEERGARTEMTFQKGPFASMEALKAENEGWNESFDRLQEQMEKRGRSGRG